MFVWAESAERDSHHEGPSLSRDLRINEMIRVPNLRVVDEDGSQLGVMPTGQALHLAQERGYDLVEVAPMAAPPVARLLDYGQFKYEQARREKEARRHQRSVEFKEIRLKPKIGKGDFDTKVRRAIQFLEDGDRLKVTCQFRGREVSHAYIGRDLLIRFGEMIKDHGTVERQPILEGKSMSMVVTSLHKPKVMEPVAGERGHERAEDAERAPTTTPESQGAPTPAPEAPAPVAAEATPVEAPAPAAKAEAPAPAPKASTKKADAAAPKAESAAPKPEA
ncbi:MAG: translation initiation factor IF-3, partial [Candidatus Limnocylindrales bacterium]